MHALIILCLACVFPLFSLEMPVLFQKNWVTPCTSYEKKMVKHAKTSFEKALKLESKLSGHAFEETEDSLIWRSNNIPNYHCLRDLPRIPYYHLLNNLCHFNGASHLHVGLLAGDSYIAALYGNQDSMSKQQIGLDWFKECPESIFNSNCALHLNLVKCRIISSGCFDVDKSLFKAPIDIYFYDADHSFKGHEKALTYFHSVFADTFIAVIDDWNCPWIRRATFKAFEKLNYSILYQNFIPKTADDNGQYIAVIRKDPKVVAAHETPAFPGSQDTAFTALKRRVCEHLQGSWCSEEKASLIMDLIISNKPRVCVEIGTYSGSSFLPIVVTLAYLKTGMAFAIDPWSNVEAVKGIPENHPQHSFWSSLNMAEAKSQFIDTMEYLFLSPYYCSLEMASRDAASKFNLIDFLHLDGNTSEEGSYEDVRLYLPKVAPKGYILLSNALISLDDEWTKMKSIWALADQCEIIAEIDERNTILFQKNY